ncbi:MAG TPA: response regulator [Sphingomicrobium sp.]|nr:response regulator [Sphingomicrobium sp.]
MNAAPRVPDDFIPLIVYDGVVELRVPARSRPTARPSGTVERPEHGMLEILIVENDPQISDILKDMIEFDRTYRVTGIATDLTQTLAAIESHRPGLALVDIHLGGYATGIEVAARTLEAGIPTLFSTGHPLPFPVPELALGCLCKPYTCYSVSQSLRIAEQIIRGDSVDYEVPLELELY